MRWNPAVRVLPWLLWVLGCDGYPAEATVVSARTVGLLEQSAWISGRDGGQSARVWDRAVWVFGDTVLTAPDERGLTWHHNSYSFTSDGDGADGVGGFVEPADGVGAPAYLLAPTAEEQAFNDAHQGDPCAESPCGARWAVWPTAVVFDAPRDRALLFYDLIYAEPGDMNFRGVGSSVAIWDDPARAPTRPTVAPGEEHPTLLFPESAAGYGEAAVIDGGLLYAYACEREDLTFHCTLGRVEPAEVEQRAAWRFWDGEGWSESADDALCLFHGASIVAVYFNRHLARWCAVYSAPLDDDVLLRTAPALTGPWSEELVLFTAERGTDEGWVYDAVPHPELSAGDDRVLYVTYSRPNGEGWFGAEFPLVRVEFE